MTSEETIIPEDKVVEALSKVSKPWGLISGVGLLGLAAGGALGYFLTRRQLESKYNTIVEEEIAEMREHYRRKLVGAENTILKPELETLVDQQGYKSNDEAPPMVVTPPASVVEAAEAAKEEGVVETKAPDPEETRNIFRDTPSSEWDEHKERAQRSPVRPYVIRYDEREELGYEVITYTYYEDDDVVCNEKDEVIDASDRERIIGEKNLDRFGHGSDDDDIVYVRNDALQMEMEIVKSDKSYAEEVHGFKHSVSRRTREREPFDDE